MKRFFTCFAVTIAVFAALSALSCTLSLSPDKSNSGGTGKVYLTLGAASRSVGWPAGNPEEFASFKNIKVWIIQGDRIIGERPTIESPVSYPITLDIPYGAGYVARALIEVDKTSSKNRSRANFYVGESKPFKMAGASLNVQVSLRAGDIMATLKYASPGWTIDGILNESDESELVIWGSDSDRVNPPRILNDKFGRLIVAGYPDFLDTSIPVGGIYIYEAGRLVDSLTVNSSTIDEFLDIAYDDASSILYVLGLYESNEKIFSFNLNADELSAVDPMELEFKEGKLSGVRSFASYTAGSEEGSFIYAPYIPDMDSSQEAPGIAIFLHISGTTVREYGSIPFPESANIKDMEVIDNTLAVLVSSGEAAHYCMMYFYDLAGGNRLIGTSSLYEGVDTENGGTYSIVGYDQTGVFVYSSKYAGSDTPIEERTFRIDWGGSGAGF
ncbi:MAG: hypothetical protein LBF78_14790 [Treponema sp.]|jgi:hypothetical protein|nr:hypothetical protein [Treponema sp.]